VCRRLKQTEENTESKTSDTPTERSLSQCAGFCANQPENCNTMSLWCGGCPVCRRLKQTEENTESKTSETSDRQLDDSNDWKEFDQKMQQLHNKVQEMQNQINACSSWTKFASSSISENGLYCQQNGENYKCSSTPAGLNGISVVGCPENLTTDTTPNVVMI